MAEALVEPPAKVRSRTFAALADYPDYRRYYFGQGVSLVGTWLQAAAVSWIVFEMTGSTRTLGRVEAAGVLPGLLVGLQAGALADRLPPKTMILTMQVAQMLLAFLLAFFVGLQIVQIWQLALILALSRVCVTFEMPSRQVLLLDLVGRSSLMNAIALNSGLFNASRVIGPALAGLCLARFGRTACFALNGASYLAAIAALLSIRARCRPVVKVHESSHLMGGLAYVRGNRRAATLFALMMFFGVVGMGYAAMIPAYARLVIHTKTVGYSVLVASGGLGATFGALVIASLGGLARKERLVPAGMLVFATALASAGILPAIATERWALPIACLCLSGTGFGAIFFFAATQTLIQTAVPDALRGRVMGIWMIAYSASVPLGAMGAGEVALRWGVGPVMIASAAACGALAVLVAASGLLRESAQIPPARSMMTEA